MAQKIITPKIKSIEIFIDDGGDRQINFQGYTGLAIDNYTYSDLQKKLNEFYQKKSISEIHSSQFSVSKTSLFKELFEMLEYKLSFATYRLIKSFLSTNHIIAALESKIETFYDSLIKNNTNMELNTNFKALLKHVAVPIILFLQKIDCDDNLNINIHIDRKSDFEIRAKEMIWIDIHRLTILEALPHILNSYLKHMLHYQCKVKSISIEISSKNKMIQIADVFSNFSFNYIRYIAKGMLGSAKETNKYQIFKSFLVNTTHAGYTTQIENDILQNIQFTSSQITLSRDFYSVFQIT